MLLNNDVVVTPGWLESLVLAAERSPRIGLAGPVTNNISGPQRLQSVGYDQKSLCGLDDYAQLLRAHNANDFTQIWRVVGFCMLIKRQLIENIGGLDLRYGRGNFEDDDYCIRAGAAGYAAVIVHDSFVHHYGSQAFAASKCDYGNQLHQNWEIFKDKWGLPAGLRMGPTLM